MNPFRRATTAEQFLPTKQLRAEPGVLNRLVDDPKAISEVARTALELMHYENIKASIEAGDAHLLTEKDDDACARGCYRCLLSYFNQPDHEQIDRNSSEVAQLLIDLARGQTLTEARASFDGSASPWVKAFEEAALPHVDTMPVKFGGNDVEFAWRGHGVAATANSVSSEMSQDASNKGWELVSLPSFPDAGIPEQLIDLLKG